jgi:hypothetical protein
MKSFMGHDFKHQLIAFLTDAASIRIILAHLGEPATPPPLSPPWNPTTPAPDPGLTFDQTFN